MSYVTLTKINLTVCVAQIKVQFINNSQEECDYSSSKWKKLRTKSKQYRYLLIPLRLDCIEIQIFPFFFPKFPIRDVVGGGSMCTWIYLDD